VFLSFVGQEVVLFNVGWLFAVYVVFDVTSLKMAM
jgi:hypothetical protein